MQDTISSPESKPDQPPAPRKQRCRISPKALGYSIYFGVIAVVVSVAFVQFIVNAHEATNRALCNSHLKGIVLGLQLYQDVHGAFPPAYTVDAEGNPLHSWRTLILPYIDRQELYASIDLSKPWDDPVNAHARNTQLPIFACPSLNLPPGFTTYQAIVGPDACLHPTEPRKLSDIKDGTKNSLILVEVTQPNATHWMSPVDHGKQFLLGIGHETGSHPHTRLHLVYANGLVRSFPDKIYPEVFPGLINIDDHLPFCDEF